MGGVWQSLAYHEGGRTTPKSWTCTLESHFADADKLPMLKTVEIACWLIIGADFAGLSTTRKLQQEALSDPILLLEAKQCAEGSAGRSSGLGKDLPNDLAS